MMAARARPHNVDGVFHLTLVTLRATLDEDSNIVHKALRRLYAESSAKGLPADCVPKLRNMLAFLQDMNDPEELVSLPTWNAHRLSGSRAGTWSLHVTRNWRLTFWIDTDDAAVCDIDFEDYH